MGGIRTTAAHPPVRPRGTPPPDLPPERGEEPESQGVGYLADVAVAGPGGARLPPLSSPLKGGGEGREGG